MCSEYRTSAGRGKLRREATPSRAIGKRLSIDEPTVARRLFYCTVYCTNGVFSFSNGGERRGKCFSQRCPHHSRGIFHASRAKVSELYIPFPGDEDVCWLDVTVNSTARVQKVQRLIPSVQIVITLHTTRVLLYRT